MTTEFRTHTRGQAAAPAAMNSRARERAVQIETTPAVMLQIMERNPAIARLIRNEWVRLACLDPHSPDIQMFLNGQFQPYKPLAESLPHAATSADWYRGWRDHLEFAEIGN